jgi:hypothetical protein
MKRLTCAAVAASTIWMVGMGLPAQTPPAAQTRPAETQASEPEANTASAKGLKTVGALAAAHLYEAYLSVGAMADGKEQETYQTKEAQRILETVDTLLAGIDKQLGELLACEDLGKQDRETLTKIRAANALLTKQSAQLQAYWKTGKEDDASKYEATRQEAWKAISDILGLNK